MAQDVSPSEPNNSPKSNTDGALLASLLACPACGAALDDLHCSSCAQQYPQLGPLPWLLPQPDAQRHEWRNRWHLALRNLQAQEQSCESALAATSSALSKQRLQQLQQGYAGQRQAVQALLAPLDLGLAASRETYQALRTPLPEQHRLFSYAPNLFRDWCWGQLENRGAVTTINETLENAQWQPQTNTSKVLLLGSGGGRLAHDLHCAWQPAITLGLEINPYLALAAATVCSGEPLSLYEFPLAPCTEQDVALKRTLQRPEEPLPPGLMFAVADALAPPLAKAQFDLVITPWFTDVCGAPVPQLAALVNSLLKPQGCWLNHGSVAFQESDPGNCLSLAEFTEQACEQGFRSASSVDCTLPYLRSPSSRHSRLEQINSTCLVKVESVVAPARHALASPQWLEDLEMTVPQLPAFASQIQATAIHAFIMSLIDGKRSVTEMAAVMAARGMMTPEDAKQALCGFLQKMHAEATGKAGL